MVVTIVILVALSLVIIGVLGIRALYLLVTNNSSSMQTDNKTKMVDVCLYVGIAISLIASVTNGIQVLFAAINRKFFDPLASSYQYIDTSSSDVRFAIASLVVMFPIYLVLSYLVSRDMSRFHYKQDLGIRKFFVYTTLFIAVLSLVGTLVSVIYTYLGGELSVRFGLKALSVMVITLALFVYYAYSLRRNYAKKTRVPLIIASLVTALVVASVVWSISVVGTPSVMRMKKIDSTRLSDISRIQQEVLSRVQNTGKLPATLEELDNAFQGYAVPSDPVTKESYGYRVVEQPVIRLVNNRKEMVSNGVFELCSMFSTKREYNQRGQLVSGKEDITAADSFYSASNYYYEGDASPFWNHEAEYTCFKRVITKDMYYGN